MSKPPGDQRFRIAALVSLVFLAGLMALAQQPQPTPEPPPTGAQGQNEPVDIGEQTTFKVSVDVVNILFNVKDKRGALIPELRKEDFALTEDGAKQTIKFFASESNLPLTLGILLDTSGSQARVLPMEQEIGASFLKQVIRSKDLAFLINFDVNVELLQDFTSSTAELRRALQSARINTGGGTGSSIPGIGQGPVPIEHVRSTALYDAIYLAATEKLAREVGRKAMIVLTDGMDYGSKVDIKQAIEAAQKADAIVYILLAADPPFYGSAGSGGGYHGEGEMKKLAQETGGRVIDVGDRQARIKEAFDQVANELRSQYSIGYTPTNATRDGSFRKIEIKTKAGKVQARRGYYALAR
jgi:VWFA-related protein